MTFCDDALSPAARGDGEFKNPAAWLRPREAASTLLLDVLALSSQQGRALHAARSVVCFHTKPGLCRVRSVSPPGGRGGGIVGRQCPLSLLSLRGCCSLASPQVYLLLYIFILRQQSFPRRHLKVDERIKGVRRVVCQDTFFNHCLGCKQERLA